VEWEDRLDAWELELELASQLEGSDWVTLDRAAADTGASRAALRTWYRSGQIPSRLVDGPHGPQRLVPLALVAERARGCAATPNGASPTRPSWKSSGTGSTSSSSAWPRSNNGSRPKRPLGDPDRPEAPLPHDPSIFVQYAPCVPTASRTWPGSRAARPGPGQALACRAANRRRPAPAVAPTNATPTRPIGYSTRPPRMLPPSASLRT